MIRVKTDQLLNQKNLGCIQLTNPTSGVCGGPVDLGEVLTGEGASTVGSPPSVGVDDYLTTGQTGITLGAANNEASRRLYLSEALYERQRSDQGRGEEFVLT